MKPGSTKVFIVILNSSGWDFCTDEPHLPYIIDEIQRKIYFTKQDAENAAASFSKKNPGAPELYLYEDYSVVEVEIPFIMEDLPKRSLEEDSSV